MLFEAIDVARPHLLGEAIDDLDAGQIALVHGAVERLAGERFLVDRAVGIAIEETAELVLQLADALDRAWCTSVQARSWSASHLLPSIVSMKWRSTESPAASATL